VFYVAGEQHSCLLTLMGMRLYLCALCLRFWKCERSIRKVVCFDIIIRVIGKVSLNALGQLHSYKETAETSKYSNNYFFLEAFIFLSE
jgi:hypothetical protein